MHNSLRQLQQFTNFSFCGLSLQSLTSVNLPGHDRHPSHIVPPSIVSTRLQSCQRTLQLILRTAEFAACDRPPRSGTRNSCRSKCTAMSPEHHNKTTPTAPPSQEPPPQAPLRTAKFQNSMLPYSSSAHGHIIHGNIGGRSSVHGEVAGYRIFQLRNTATVRAQQNSCREY